MTWQDIPLSAIGGAAQGGSSKSPQERQAMERDREDRLKKESGEANPSSTEQPRRPGSETQTDSKRESGSSDE